MCDPHTPETDPDVLRQRAITDAAIAREQGHHALADTILRDAGIDPAPPTT